MKALAIALTALAVLGACATLGAFGMAIWTYGPNSMRWGGTGMVAMFLSIGLSGAAAFTWIEVADRG